MVICKPYLYKQAADKLALTVPREYQCRLECPYGLDLLPLPKKASSIEAQPKPQSVEQTCSKEPISYKTSTGIASAHRFNTPFVVNFDQAPLPRELLKQDVQLQTELYKTTHGTSFVRYALDTSRLNSKPPRGGRGMAMKIYADRVSAHPTRPMIVLNSTMKDSYPPHAVPSTEGTVVPTIMELCECRLNRVGLDCEPPLPREEGGFATELDFMLPTSAKDFRRFRPDEIHGDAPVTIYTERGYTPGKGIAPILGSCRPAPGPIWDGIRTKKRASDTYVPHKPQLVPHTGMCSETRAKFQHRTDISLSDSVFPITEYPIHIYPYTSKEVFLCPGMYVPESVHYGSRIPVCRMVDIAKRETSIDFCTMKKKAVAVKKK